jgi:serine/threonine-protein kinase RsbW
MAIPFKARLPGTPLGVRRLRREMAGLAADCGMDPEAIADVRLAVTEAATNAVMHAYAEAPGDLTVTAAVEDGELAIVIGDTGPGFDVRDSPGLGVGLSVIATVAERLRIVSGTRGTEVHMAFPCPSAATQP